MCGTDRVPALQLSTVKGGFAIKAFLNRFSAWALALATVGGLYLSALSLNLVAAFWVLMAVAVAVAAIPPLWRKVVDLIMQARRYPQLEGELAHAREELDQLKSTAPNVSTRIAEARILGIREGQAQTKGTFLALLSPVPTVTAVVNDDGEVALAGTCTDTKVPKSGARYFVIERITGEVKGVVELRAARAVAAEQAYVVILRMIEPRSEAFWKHLAGRVEFDTTPPPGIELRRFGVDAKIDEGGRLVNHETYDALEGFDETEASRSGLEEI